MATWANECRFIIGTDLGEENYYIHLTEPSPKIYCFDIEDGSSRQVAESVEKWLAKVKLWQDESEDEAQQHAQHRPPTG